MNRLYPNHMASLRRQQKAHERAVKRKSSQPKFVTKKEARAILLNERRNAERKARHAKHANKAKILIYG